jgi:tetratricopeptide (TPR) repeat protein
MYLAKAGKLDDARAQLTAGAEKAADADHDSAAWTASAYALLGDKDKALDWLEHAIKLGNENRPWFETDFTLESLRNEPRFLDLMESIKKD